MDVDPVTIKKNSRKNSTARKSDKRKPKLRAENSDAAAVRRSSAMTELRVTGARTHNLKNMNIAFPHNQLSVVTGVSGSGKSSLAFDTIYAEGQRQYIESLSTYARQFLNQMQRADVDSIDGLQPTLCIDQRSGIANPRSTVATVTEVYDYLRLLMARTGTPHCSNCGSAILQQPASHIHQRLIDLPEGTRLVMLAPVVRGRKGTHRDVLDNVQKAGLVRVRVDGELYDVDAVPDLELRKNHSIDAVVDKIVIRPDNVDRVSDSLDVALKLSGGLVTVSYLTPAASETAEGDDRWTEELFSTLYSCSECGLSIEEIEPRTFSFNSPYGACRECDGLGVRMEFDRRLILLSADALVGKGKAESTGELPPEKGGLPLLTEANGTVRRELKAALKQFWKKAGLDWAAPAPLVDSAAADELLTGRAKRPGLVDFLNTFYQSADEDLQLHLAEYRDSETCPACRGSRIRAEALAVRLQGKSMLDIVSMSLSEAFEWLDGLVFPEYQQPVARPIMNEMMHRFRFLQKVGVGYLTLGRAADTLSGGELQRVRLATCIGSGLVGVCYILDEPSIGLHQRDNDRLIESLRNLQQQGNTVIVVEHDEAMMLAADRLYDIGPGAGRQGGRIVAQGTPSEVRDAPDSLTAQFLRGERSVVPDAKRDAGNAPDGHRRVPTKSRQLKLRGATLHNLKSVDVDVPLGLLVGITGVSGSGKSSLIGETLIPALARELKLSTKARPGPYRKLMGIKHVDKLIQITQSPIGRTPRSTPATYCGVFDLIRAVWANTREAKQRGYTLSRFSFNSGAGRCSQCQGQGLEKMEMNFLPDLFVTCSVCNGARFNRQTLNVRYRDRSIADVLRMSIDEATEFFENFPKIHRLLSSLQQVGLGYVTLGQSSTTLSGGESQRVKLATELARAETGQAVYFLDEPTTGLHFEDVRRLVNVLDGLVDRGNTVLVIEHNLDVIRSCDWLIDVGPEGGEAGGRIVAAGPPETIAAAPESLTGSYL